MKKRCGDERVLAAAGTGHGDVGRRVGFPAQFAATAVNDAVGRTRVQVDVAVRAAGTPEEPGRVLSLGEAKWGETMGLGHLARLRRARDLLSAKGEPAADAVLACYGGAGFTSAMATLTRPIKPHRRRTSAVNPSPRPPCHHSSINFPYRQS